MAAVETPSKVAAAALSNIDLNTVHKPSGDLLAKMKAAAAAEQPVGKQVIVATTAADDKADVEEFRKRFVGDVECEEKDEPLLKESNSRFVLFPIKYREVSSTLSLS